jgi:hypothetical protein
MSMTSPTSEARPKSVRPRYDPLAEFNRPATPALDPGRAAGGVFASALLVGGVGICLWVVVMIHRALNGPSELALLRRLTPVNPEDVAIKVPSGTIQLPPATLTVIGYFFAFVLLAVAGRIAVALVREGSRLLRSTLSRPAEPVEEDR